MFTLQKYSFFLVPPRVFLNILLFVVFFYAFRGQYGFAVGLSASDIPRYSTAIPIAMEMAPVRLK